MKCKYCGRDLLEGAKFCVGCGKPVEEVPTQEVSIEQSQPTEVMQVEPSQPEIKVEEANKTTIEPQEVNVVVEPTPIELPKEEPKQEVQPQQVVVKKSNKGLVVILVIIIIVLLGACGYLVYDNYIKKDSKPVKTENKKKETKEEEKFEELSVTDQVVVNLMNNVLPKSNQPLMMKDNYYMHEKANVQSVPNETKIYLGVKKLVKESGKTGEQTFTKEQVKESIQTIFGKDVVYTDESSIGCPFIVYDATQATYLYKETCGGALLPNFIDEVISAKKYSDRIEIEVKAAQYYYNTQEGATSVTATLSKAIDKNNIVIPEITNPNPDPNTDKIKETFESNKDKFDTYKFTFMKDGDNYYFTSSEIVK